MHRLIEKDDNQEEQAIKDRIWEVIKIRALAQNKHPVQVAKELLQEIRDYKNKKLNV